MRLLVGSFVIVYNVDHIALMILCWAAMAWFSESPSASLRQLDVHSLKGHVMLHSTAADWTRLVTQTVLGSLIALLARYALRRPLRIVWRWKHEDMSHVVSNLVVAVLILAVGMFCYDATIKLRAVEDSALFPIGRVIALLVGLFFFSVLYVMHSHWTVWNWLYNNAPPSSANMGSSVGTLTEHQEKQSLSEEERSLSVWLLAQCSIYGALIIVDILLVQTIALSLAFVSLLAGYLLVMFVFKKLADLW